MPILSNFMIIMDAKIFSAPNNKESESYFEVVSTSSIPAYSAPGHQETPKPPSGGFFICADG